MITSLESFWKKYPSKSSLLLYKDSPSPSNVRLGGGAAPPQATWRQQHVLDLVPDCRMHEPVYQEVYQTIQQGQDHDREAVVLRVLGRRNGLDWHWHQNFRNNCSSSWPSFDRWIQFLTTFWLEMARRGDTQLDISIILINALARAPKLNKTRREVHSSNTKKFVISMFTFSMNFKMSLFKTKRHHRFEKFRHHFNFNLVCILSTIGACYNICHVMPLTKRMFRLQSWAINRNHTTLQMEYKRLIWRWKLYSSNSSSWWHLHLNLHSRLGNTANLTWSTMDSATVSTPRNRRRSTGSVSSTLPLAVLAHCACFVYVSWQCQSKFRKWFDL